MVEKLNRHGLKPYRIQCYVLIEDVDDAYMRNKELMKMGVEPFAQPYRDFETNYVNPEHKRLARWCNHVAIRKTVKFEDYEG